MILKYGNYSFAQNEAAISVKKTPIYSGRGIRKGTKHAWQITGDIREDSQQAFTTSINLLEAAMIDGFDLALYLDDGSTLSAHLLLSGQTVGGTKVTGPDYPVGQGSQYATIRSYQITIEGEVFDTRTNLLDYEEALDFTGTGGPKEIFLPTMTGRPILQTVQQATVYRASQSGFAVGYLAYPPANGPIWPAAEIGELRRIRRVSPKNNSGSLTEYRVQWQYTFQSASILKAAPRVR